MKEFQSPSERLAGALKRFFLLQQLDGPKLLRGIWITALVFYGIQFVVAALTVLAYLDANSRFPNGWTWYQLFAPLLTRMLEPLLWLLSIRPVLEVCARTLQILEPKQKDRH
jgi:hypothetical protein